MQYWFAVLHSHVSHWLTKWLALLFRIIAQYSMNTKFDDALKILVACEKMANCVVGCQNAMCQSLHASFLKLFVLH